MPVKTFALQGADPRDASLRVLIIPHSGAGAASGQGFAEHAPVDWLVATARLPGRETRIREGAPELPGLVDDVVATVRALPGTAPLIVVGVCSGAIIGLEAVRALQRGDGDRPDDLDQRYDLDHRHDPDRRDAGDRRDDKGRVVGLVVVSQWAVTEKPDPERRLLRDADGTDDVLAILDGFGGVPASLAANAEMLELVLPTIVADIRAVEDYSSGPDPLLGCPLLTVFGDEDELCPEERTDDWSLFSDNTRTAWVPGGHMLLTESPAQVVDALVGNLDQFAVDRIPAPAPRPSGGGRP